MVALVVAAVSPYLTSLAFDYVLDDRQIIRQNEAIRGWGALVTLWTKPYWITAAGEPGQGLYRPMFMVILSILWNTGLRYPIFFHLFVVAAHAAATVLVFRLTRRAVSLAGATVAALWFAVQPVHVEAVVNVANSSEVLVAVATLALALSLLRADERIAAGGAVPWSTAMAGAGIFAAAVLTKESGVTAPALAMLVVWGWRTPPTPSIAPMPDAVRFAWARWRPLVVCCAAVVAVVLIARFLVLESVVSRASIAAEGLPESAWQRTWAMFSLWPNILELLTWPRELNPMYGPRLIADNLGPNGRAWRGFALLVLAAWIALRRANRGDRRLACVLAWAVIAFAPASNLLVPTGQILAERTLYVSSVGVAMLLGIGVEWALARVQQVSMPSQRILQAAGTIAVLLMTIGVARSTRQRSLAWKDHGALFQQAIKADPGDYRPHLELAKYRLAMGDTVAALGSFAEMMRFPEALRDADAVAAYLKAQRTAPAGRK